VVYLWESLVINIDNWGEDIKTLSEKLEEKGIRLSLRFNLLYFIQ
jgi:hypothetical protein